MWSSIPLASQRSKRAPGEGACVRRTTSSMMSAPT